MTDYFLSRRLVQLMVGNLKPRGYTFVRWSTRGDEKLGQVYEFTFVTPDGLREVATGISALELDSSPHKVKTIAGVLSNRIVKKIEGGSISPPSPA